MYIGPVRYGVVCIDRYHKSVRVQSLYVVNRMNLLTRRLRCSCSYLCCSSVQTYMMDGWSDKFCSYCRQLLVVDYKTQL